MIISIEIFLAYKTFICMYNIKILNLIKLYSNFFLIY